MIRRIINRDPKLLIPMGFFITNIGSGMYTLAVGMLLYDATGKVTSFAFVVVVETIAKFLSQAFASLVVDSGRAKESAAFADILRGIIVFVCGVSLYFGHTALLYVVTVLKSLLSPFYRTATFALGPQIAKGDDLAKYNASTSTCAQMGQLLGAGIAGSVMTMFSPQFVVLVNGVSYLISAACIAIIKIPQKNVVSQYTNFGIALVANLNPKLFVREWVRILKVVYQRKQLLNLLIFCTMDYLVISFINIIYAPALENMQLPTYMMSIWDSLFAIGAIIGASVFGKAKIFHRSVKLCPVFLIIEGIGLMSFATKNPYWIVVCMLFIGVANAISSSSFNYSLQVCADQEFHGRITGLRQFFISISTATVIPIVSRCIEVSIFFATAIILILCFAYSGILTYKMKQFSTNKEIKTC